MSILGRMRSASRGLGHKELGLRSDRQRLICCGGLGPMWRVSTLNFKSVDSHVAYLAGTAKELQSQRVDGQFLVWIPHLE